MSNDHNLSDTERAIRVRWLKDKLMHMSPIKEALQYNRYYEELRQLEPVDPNVKTGVEFKLEAVTEEPIDFGAMVLDSRSQRWLHVAPERSGGWSCEGMMALGQWEDIPKPAVPALSADLAHLIQGLAKKTWDRLAAQEGSPSTEE